jgi:DNA-binding Lrp family transcriptional regulator
MADSDLRIKIAQLLERDCRLTPVEIARMLDSSESEVEAEIGAMETEGVIVRYGAKINWEKLSAGVKVYATIGVQVVPERGVGFDGVAERIVHFPEVHSMYLISGSHDFDVVVEGDSMRDIAFFVAQRLAVIPGVRSTQTQFVLQTYKRDGDILLDTEENERLSVTP